VIISGGGTGGHIYPAIAIARGLQKRFPDTEFLFVGAKDRMEMEKVPQAGFPIEGLWISGIQRSLSIENLKFPFKLLSSLFKARKIVNRFKPDVVIGTGGYASGPVLKIACNKHIPALIQEQNSYAGITNKLLGKSVQKICVAYDHMERFFPESKIVKTGNPVRSDLLSIEDKKTKGLEAYNLRSDVKVVLILGGSLGALAINKLIDSRLSFFEEQKMQVLWQTGKYYYERYKDRASDSIKVMAYIDKMDLAYAASDIIISRAGASSVSELCIVGKAVVFIPSPNVAEDHQTKNAEAIVQENAGILIKEQELESRFEAEMKTLISDKVRREAFGDAIKKLALPQATASIVDEVEQLLTVRLS